MRTVIRVWVSVVLLAWACSSEKTDSVHGGSNAGNAGSAGNASSASLHRGTIVGAIQ
ncbi:MAG TPA: hypothetical protein VL137_04285 [Polyangiaceae bacterium]|nr:hypothetical protein [Polyangiaceae bacterium]